MEYFRFLLYPFALIYGLVVFLRNKLFDWRVISSTSFPVPTLVVGNLSVGGSGKSPLVEYIVRLLKEEYVIATLSRGYKRKSKGFLRVSPEETVENVGDEPLQIARKYPGIHVFVDENRKRGIRQIMAQVPGLDAVILDDAFQHRFVKPWINILVTDYHNLYNQDHLLPVGRLRESRSGARRSNMIVVSKSPKIFSPLVRRQILEDLRPGNKQPVCFSYISYENWLPVYSRGMDQVSDLNKITTILMVSGIANPSTFEEYLKPLCSDIVKLEFNDHQEYTEEKLEKIRDSFLALPTRKKVIVTTEKDCMRFRNQEAESKLSEFPFYYVPIKFEFHPQDKEIFDAAIRAILRQKSG